MKWIPLFFISPAGNVFSPYRKDLLIIRHTDESFADLNYNDETNRIEGREEEIAP